MVTPAGEIVALDQLRAEAIVFDSAGALVRTIGRSGQGPGELSENGPTSIILLGDTLVIPDLLSRRINLFDQHGAFLAAVPMPANGSVPVEWRAASTAAVRLEDTRWAGIVGWKGRALQDTLVAFESAPPVPFDGRFGVLPAFPLWDLTQDGEVLATGTRESRIRVYDRMGRPSVVIDRSAPDVAFTPDDKREFLRILSERFGASSTRIPEGVMSQFAFPETMPSTAAVRAGPDGTIWVQRVRSTREMDMRVLSAIAAMGLGGRIWDIYSRDGEHLGEASADWPVDLRVFARGHAYGIVTGDLGVEYIGVFEIPPNLSRKR